MRQIERQDKPRPASGKVEIKEKENENERKAVKKNDLHKQLITKSRSG